MSVLTGLNLEKMYGLSFPRNKANCSSVFIGCLLGLTVFSWRRYKDDLLMNCGLSCCIFTNQQLA